MSKRFTSGGVGRFSFDEANAALAAADAMLAGFVDQGKRITVPEDPPLVVKLTQDLGDQMFDPGPKGIKYRVWNWAEVHVDQGSTRKKIASVENGRTADKFGDSPLGRAIQLGGTAIVGETVVLFRIMAFDGKPWFCFHGRPVVSGQTSMLRLTGYQDLGEGMFTYQVQPIHWPDDDRSDLPAGIGYNLYERSDRHGQRLTFSNPDSRLIVEGPVQGPVFGVIASAPNLPVVWVFDVPNPLNVECVTDVPQLIEQTLRDGI
jgi:hypothetical protein